MKKILLALMMVSGLFGCATGKSGSKDPLVVGVTPDYPPVIFSQNGELAGLEYDLMRKLRTELDRPITVTSLPWDEQIDALVSGKIDIIMSGMSITEPRKVKIAFTDSWMRGGLLAMMRRADKDRYPTVASVQNSAVNIGVLSGTTAHDYVRRNCKNARVIKIASAADASIQLQRKTIDLFIYDIPSIAWQVASNEAELAALLEPLNREDIAWGIRRDDPELEAQLNQAIQHWRADGSLDAAILKWVPYYNRIK